MLSNELEVKYFELSKAIKDAVMESEEVNKILADLGWQPVSSVHESGSIAYLACLQSFERGYRIGD